MRLTLRKAACRSAGRARRPRVPPLCLPRLQMLPPPPPPPHATAHSWARLAGLAGLAGLAQAWPAPAPFRRTLVRRARRPTTTYSRMLRSRRR